MSSSPGGHTRSRGGWAALQFVLLLETLAGAVWVAVTIPRFLAASGDPLGARVSVMLTVARCWAWVAITLLGARKGAGWARGSALTIHVLMFAAATGVLQGMLGELPGVGVALLVLAVAGFVASILARPQASPEEVG